ncbi:MAG: prephenate dehydrogenase [Flavobacteriaceae bacterium]|nr:prephenate dehydrogenase [Flavobacteriaceae bacterium]
MKTIIVIGLGLIGGSMALDLKNSGKYKVLGSDKSEININKAKKLGMIDHKADESDFSEADIIIVATPVNTIADICYGLLYNISTETLLIDVGSVKNSICNKIDTHINRGNFLASHPIAGTEHSGPDAALTNLFRAKTNIICDSDKTNAKLLKKGKEMFRLLGMKSIYMSSEDHDRHIAYVSHISHISSFMLGKTVMEIEKDEKSIFDMAGSGFASTVRLAKSASSMWTPIFIENKKNIVKSLDEYIKNLQEFREDIIKENKESINSTINKTNHIKNILKGI